MARDREGAMALGLSLETDRVSIGGEGRRVGEEAV